MSTAVAAGTVDAGGEPNVAPKSWITMAAVDDEGAGLHVDVVPAGPAPLGPVTRIGARE